MRPRGMVIATVLSFRFIVMSKGKDMNPQMWANLATPHLLMKVLDWPIHTQKMLIAGVRNHIPLCFFFKGQTCPQPCERAIQWNIKPSGIIEKKTASADPLRRDESRDREGWGWGDRQDRRDSFSHGIDPRGAFPWAETIVYLPHYQILFSTFSSAHHANKLMRFSRPTFESELTTSPSSAEKRYRDIVARVGWNKIHGWRRQKLLVLGYDLLMKILIERKRPGHIAISENIPATEEF